MRRPFIRFDKSKLHCYQFSSVAEMVTAFRQDHSQTPCCKCGAVGEAKKTTKCKDWHTRWHAYLEAVHLVSSLKLPRRLSLRRRLSKAIFAIWSEQSKKGQNA